MANFGKNNKLVIRFYNRYLNLLSKRLKIAGIQSDFKYGS